MLRHVISVIFVPLFTLAVIVWDASSLQASHDDESSVSISKAIVLMYHHIDPKPANSNTITPQQFEEQMKYIAEGGFHPISLSTLCRCLDGKAEIPQKAVAITFDDGYESFYRFAFPVLKRLNLPATVFVIVSSIGIIPPEGTIKHFGWDEMLEMQASGLIEFGSHTYKSHYYVQTDKEGRRGPAMTSREYNVQSGVKESDADYLSRIRDDLFISEFLLRMVLGRPVTALAMPYGAYSPEAIGAAEEAGFKYIFTTKPGVVTRWSDKTCLKRINAGYPEETSRSLAALAALIDR